MKLLLCVVFAAAVSALSDQELWANFKKDYGKRYGTMDQEAARFAIFQMNLRRAEEYQADSPSATFGVTKFMDLSPSEFKAQYANLNRTQVHNWRRTLPQAKLNTVGATYTDWVAKKLVSSVKDQGQCGSCWAFSAAAAMEGCVAASQGKVVDVSAQQVVDCCTKGGSDGCNGGYPDQCLNWATTQNMYTWSSYPYKTAKGTCKTSGTVAVPSGTCSYHSVGATESALTSALVNAPVSVCLDATPLQYYTSGIISGSSCNDHSVDHAVLLVANSATALTIKNSWGSSWGEAGYVRLAPNVNCLDVTSESSYAIGK